MIIVITNEEINKFIEKIPPTPVILKATINFVNQGELTKAAKVAAKDPALSKYLTTLVNKPIYGFKNEVHDLSQIFGILGTSGAKQVLYSYMLSLLSPSKWELFKLNETLFYDLQAKLSIRWKKILTHLKIDDKDIASSITLLPASIIVCEALFKTHKEDVALLRSAKALDYNTILKRLGGVDLFDISEKIATIWEYPEKISQIIQAASGVKPADDPQINLLGKWMHLQLFHTLSQNAYIEAGLNDFIDFHVEYVEDIYEEFAQLLEKS
jgi:HD-like signal output (HDOD) protein